MKISLSKTVKNGKASWMVSFWPAGGKRRRLFFPSRAAAERERERIAGEVDRTGRHWLALDGREREALIAAAADAAKVGVDLRAAVQFFSRQAGTIRRMALREAVEAFVAERMAAGLAWRSIDAIRDVLRPFKAGRENVFLDSISREDVLSFVAGGSVGAWRRNGRLIVLKGFFRWAVEAERLLKSPAEGIKPIRLRQMPGIDRAPVVLSNAQVRALLTAALEHDPGLVPYIAVCLFAGLRPEREAARLAWADIDAEGVWVRAVHSKTRQHRCVIAQPALRSWLSLGGDLPVVNLRRRFDRVRKSAGLFRGWTQDVMRHTFASNHLVKHGLANTVAALGHVNNTMLFRHYRSVVSSAAAEEFWSIVPPSAPEAAKIIQFG